MEKPSQWVIQSCAELYFADEYAKRTVGLPSRRHVPDIVGALRAVQAILPKLEAKMIEFLAEWMVTLLMPASHVLEVIWKFDTLCETTLWVRVKRHAIHHWLYSLCTEDMWKVTARVHRVMADW